MSADEHSAGAPYRIAALTLAAGRSLRMEGSNKLLVELDGIPVVVRVVRTLISSQAKPIVVVTGYQEGQVRQALSEYDVVFAHNPEYADGMSTSLRHGVATLPSEIDGVLVCLADMPWITADHINRLISSFDPLRGRTICVPTSCGQRGNPVLWGKLFLPEISRLVGDAGARDLIAKHTDHVCEVEMEDAAVLTDVDTPADLNASRHHP